MYIGMYARFALAARVSLLREKELDTFADKVKISAEYNEQSSRGNKQKRPTARDGSPFELSRIKWVMREGKLPPRRIESNFVNRVQYVIVPSC